MPSIVLSFRCMIKVMLSASTVSLSTSNTRLPGLQDRTHCVETMMEVDRSTIRLLLKFLKFVDDCRIRPMESSAEGLAAAAAVRRAAAAASKATAAAQEPAEPPNKKPHLQQLTRPPPTCTHEVQIPACGFIERQKELGESVHGAGDQDCAFLLVMMWLCLYLQWAVDSVDATTPQHPACKPAVCTLCC